MATHKTKPLLMDCWATDSILYEDREQMSRLSGCLMESRQQGKFTDINIEVEKKTFPCHKFVLDANCPYFKAFLSFSGNINSIQTMRLAGVSASAFELMLDFLYISKITITLNNALDLIQCSDFLQCSDVTKACGHFLIPHLTIKNCLEFYQCAEVYSINGLKDEAMKFILCHFRQIVKSSELLSVPMEVLKNIISQDTLTTPTESNVLAAVLKWVVHDSSRMAEAESLLDFVRWDLVEPCFIDGLKTAVPKDIQKLVADARNRHKPGDNKRLTAVVGVVDVELSSCFSFYSKQLSEFCEEARFPFTSRTRFHCAQLSNTMYVTGGLIRHTKKVTDEVYKFDIATFKWETKGHMLNSRYNHSSAALKGLLYVIGGQGQEPHSLPLGEVYSPNTDQWSLIKCVPGWDKLLGYSITIVSLLDKLYLMASKPMGHLCAFEYDPALEKWSNVPELEKTPMDIKTCCAVRGFLVFFELQYEQKARQSLPLSRYFRYLDYDNDSSDLDGDSREDKILKLCAFNPLNRSFPTQENGKGWDYLNSERKIGGVVQHADNLMVFRYQKDEDDPMFMYQAEVLVMSLVGPSPRFRFFADYNALTFDDSELVAFSGFSNADLENGWNG